MNKVTFFTDSEKPYDTLDYLDMDCFNGKKIPVKLHINDVKKKIFFEKENSINPYNQIKYGEEIRLGSSSHQFIKL